MQNQKLLNNKKQPQTYLCLVAGGSGGHITPAICLGKEWLEKNKHGSILFFGTNNTLDKKITTGMFCVKKLPILNLPKKPKKGLLLPLFFLKLIQSAVSVIFSFLKSVRTLKKYRPEKIISTGGLIAIPVCLAGKMLRIPIELYELNVIPGKATNFLLPLAKHFYTTFEYKKNSIKKINPILRPYPLRFSEQDKIKSPLSTLEKNILTQKINEYPVTSPFHKSKKTLFLLGGSKGSLFLNNLLKKWFLSDFCEKKDYQVIHQVGLHDSSQDWNNLYLTHKIPAYTFSYHENIKLFYWLSDIVICRGGAGTLFELEFFEKKSIVVPLQGHASNHQVANSVEMAKRHPRLFFVCNQKEIENDLSSFDSKIRKHLY